MEITVEQVEVLRALCAERDAIQKKIDAAANAIEQRAHEINQAGHQYSRTGYYPWFREFDPDGELRFEGDNSWDGTETYYFTPEQLITGPAVVAEEYAEAQRRNTERELAAAERRSAALRKQLQTDRKGSA